MQHILESLFLLSQSLVKHLLVLSVGLESLLLDCLGTSHILLLMGQHLLHDLVVGLLGLLLFLVGLEVVLYDFVYHGGDLLLLLLVLLPVQRILLPVVHDEVFQLLPVAEALLSAGLFLLDVFVLVVPVLGEDHVFHLGVFLEALESAVLLLLHLDAPVLGDVAHLDLLLQVLDLLTLATDGGVASILPLREILAALQLLGQVVFHETLLL